MLGMKKKPEKRIKNMEPMQPLTRKSAQEEDPLVIEGNNLVDSRPPVQEDYDWSLLQGAKPLNSPLLDGKTSTEALVQAVSAVVIERQDAELQTRAAEQALGRASETVTAAMDKVHNALNLIESSMQNLQAMRQELEGTLGRLEVEKAQLENIPAPAVTNDEHDEIDQVAQDIFAAMDEHGIDPEEAENINPPTLLVPLENEDLTEEDPPDISA